MPQKKAVGKLVLAKTAGHALANTVTYGPDNERKEQPKAMFVEVVLGERRCGMLVDTGATVSILRPDVAQTHGLSITRSPTSVIQTAGQGNVRVIGECVAAVKIANVRIEQKFLILKNRDKGILGLDFFGKGWGTIRSVTENSFFPRPKGTTL